jgi:hypothetical protein
VKSRSVSIVEAFLGQNDPEPVRRLERLLQCSEAPSFVPSGVAE